MDSPSCRRDRAGRRQLISPVPMPLTGRFTGSGVIGPHPGAAASAMTGVEVADVMALAQADSRGHLPASTGPDRMRYRPLRGGEADATSRHHSFQWMCPGPASARRKGNAAHRHPQSARLPPSAIPGLCQAPGSYPERSLPGRPRPPSAGVSSG